MMAAALHSPTLTLGKSAGGDAFEAVFGEDALGKLKEKEDIHAKIDTQKQLRKWELDEKLDEEATISPVLYANICHKNLMEEYVGR